MFDETYKNVLESEEKKTYLPLMRYAGASLLMENRARRVLEVAKNGMVYRSYIFRCHLAKNIMGTFGFLTKIIQNNEPAPETVSAHTNLVMEIMNEFLRIHYGIYSETVKDGYYRAEIMEAIRRHDLPENVIGDIPDNGNAIHDKKNKQEAVYFKWYSSLISERLEDIRFEQKVQKLLSEMENRSSEIGRAIYLADKISAVIMAFCYDSRGRIPYLTKYDKLSARDAAEMEIAGKNEARYLKRFRISDLWAIDYFEMRCLWQYDDTGFFTALLIAIVLEVRGEWFSWRE